MNINEQTRTQTQTYLRVLLKQRILTKENEILCKHRHAQAVHNFKSDVLKDYEQQIDSHLPQTIKYCMLLN